MIHVIKNFKKFKDRKNKFETKYYVIHPFLRSIAFGKYDNNLR